MARNIDDSIKEEDEWERDEEKDQFEEQVNEDFDDQAGENTAPSAGSAAAGNCSYPEFVCTNCKTRKRAAGKEANIPVHCGRKMVLVDHENTATLLEKLL